VTGFLVSLGVGIVTLGVFAGLTVDSWYLPRPAFLGFILAGLAGPGAGRFLMMLGVRDAGASVSAPVQAATNPVLSSLGGVVFFGEQVGLLRAAGIGLIVGGIWASARGGSANLGEGGGLQIAPRDLRVLIWPFLAGASFALADVLRKFALEADGAALLGALLGISVSFVVWMLTAVISPSLRSGLRMKRELGWFAIHGVLAGIGLATLLAALRDGDLSLVVPIFSSQPVIVILLSAVLLRRLEVLRAGTVIGAAIAAVGLVALAIG
jgi:uncharacterized membrane protein